MKPLADCRLYTFVDSAYLNGRAVELVAEQLCDGGSDLIQLRAKTSSLEEIRAMAQRVLRVTSAAGVGLVLNDHPRLALELGVPLCHVGQEDFFATAGTRVGDLFDRSPGPRVPLVGLSTHSPEQARHAIAAGADYLGVGPVFATGTKPSARPVTLEYVRWAAANVDVPWFAIGGITPRTVGSVLEAGARRICVVSAILDSPDIAEACRQFRGMLV